MGSFKKQLSLEDALQEQMKKLERFGDGGDSIDDGNPPGGSGGGGGKSGGPDGDERPVPDGPDEPWQVFAAILGLLFVVLSLSLSTYIDIHICLCMFVWVYGTFYLFKKFRFWVFGASTV